VYGTPMEPAAAAPPVAVTDDRNPILVAFPGASKQRRLTVGFRAILAIPHGFVLAFLGIGVYLVLIISWFAALFTGRLPEFAEEFVAGYLRWLTRYYGYTYLLTDVYPPFSLQDEPGYPIRVAMRPGKLNRLAVLFRLILVVWAGIVQAVVLYGLFVVMFFGWLIVLIRGTMPAALHQATSAAMRYQIRVTGYLYMLTSEYPWGLLGDGQAAAYVPPAPGQATAPAEFPAAAEQATAPEQAAAPEQGEGAPAGPGHEPPQGYSQAQWQPPGYEQPGHGDQPGHGAEPGYGAQPGYGWQPGYGAEPGYGVQPGYGEQAAYGQPEPSGGPVSWRLVLSSTARQLVGLFVVVGLVAWAGITAANIVAASSGVSRVQAINHVQNAHATLAKATSDFGTTMSSCQQQSNPLPCVTRADQAVAQAFGTFGQSVRENGMPSASSAAAADRIASAAAQLQRIFSELASASSLAQYQQTIQSSNLQQVLNQFDLDYQNLGRTLNAG
jgi:Domain of unknown function (DUF4389)/Pericardin like repeat